MMINSIVLVSFNGTSEFFFDYEEDPLSMPLFTRNIVRCRRCCGLVEDQSCQIKVIIWHYSMISLRKGQEYAL